MNKEPKEKNLIHNFTIVIVTMQGEKNVRIPNKMRSDLYLTFIFIYGTQFLPVSICHCNRAFQQPTTVSATSISIPTLWRSQCNYYDIFVPLDYGWRVAKIILRNGSFMRFFCPPIIYCKTHSTFNNHIFFDFNYNSLDCISLLAMEPHRTHRHAVWLAKVKWEWNRNVVFNNIQFEKKN